MRGDDAVGLEIVSGLLRAIAKRRSGNVSIHRPTATPERELGRFDLSKERLLIFDAVGFGGVPGQFFLSSLDESQYGFFATHNVPLRLIPGLAANPSRVFVCGIEPAELGVDEGISEAVRSSAEKVTSLVLRELGGGKDGYH